MGYSTTILTALAANAILTDAFSWQQPRGHPLFGSYFGMPGKDATYDYVVVGGGTAGLTVATRLAENRSVSVAVIEAGSFYEFSNGNHSQIPYWSYDSVSGDPDVYVNKWIDWNIISTPQPQLNNRKIHYAQGKALGGSSARNQMIYQRGSAGSYDLWAKQVGDDSYKWNNILPYFQRSAQFTPQNLTLSGAGKHTADYNASAFSPDGGPLQVSYPNYIPDFSPYGIEALERSGFPRANGFDDGDLMGVGYNPFTFDPVYKTRASSEATFLDYAITENLPLTVYPMSQAMKVNFDNSSSATGVQVQSQGMSWTLSARKEVILSAGVFHSPQLLMVSGVGPANTLRAHNITVVKDLPGVGQNMHDSVNIGGPTHNVSIPTINSILQAPGGLDQANEQYSTNATGPLGTIGSNVLSFEKLPQAYRQNFTNATAQKLAQWPADWPEIEIVPSASGSPATEEFNVGSMGILMVAAISRGNVTISSNSMLDAPVVSMNWLLDPADQEVAIQAYRRARELWSNVDPSIISSVEVSPGANVTSDADLLAYIKKATNGIHHAAATCMMGAANETMAVVDSHGKVFGVKNLRVIDVSSLRFTPPGHTQAATYGQAEKLVADIKNRM